MNFNKEPFIGTDPQGVWIAIRTPINLPVFFSVIIAIVLAGCTSSTQSPTASPTPMPLPRATTAPPTPAPAVSPESASPTAISQSVAPSPAFTSAATLTQTDSAAPETPDPTPTISNLQPVISFGYTHQRPDGNRLVAGQGNLPNIQPLDIPLAGDPRWVVAAPTANGNTLWAVALADGFTQAFQVSASGDVTEVSITPPQLPPGMPPLLKIEDGIPTLPVATTNAASLETPPIFLPTTGQMVSLQAGGELLIWDQEPVDFTPSEVRALPDARILADEAGRLLLLTDPTTRYGHGVLGDAVEAASITLVETSPVLQIALTIPIPDPTVIEGIAPIWADLTGDGIREIIVTLSNATQGAQVVVFDEAGRQIAAGPAIGRGSRWRHQLVVAPFGPRGELELVDVLTPHIGGTVEFYQLEGNILSIVARVPGYTSHVIGTRNLDMAVAGDFDGDSHLELLLPNQARTKLGAIRRTLNGAEVAWSVPVGDGVVTTNLAAVTLPDGGLAVGVGRNDGILRVWGP